MNQIEDNKTKLRTIVALIALAFFFMYANFLFSKYYTVTMISFDDLSKLHAYLQARFPKGTNVMELSQELTGNHYRNMECDYPKITDTKMYCYIHNGPFDFVPFMRYKIAVYYDAKGKLMDIRGIQSYFTFVYWYFSKL